MLGGVSKAQFWSGREGTRWNIVQQHQRLTQSPILGNQARVQLHGVLSPMFLHFFLNLHNEATEELTQGGKQEPAPSQRSHCQEPAAGHRVKALAQEQKPQPQLQLQRALFYKSPPLKPSSCFL